MVQEDQIEYARFLMWKCPNCSAQKSESSDSDQELPTHMRPVVEAQPHR